MPYLYDHFSVTGQLASTGDFDTSDGTGIPLVTLPGTPTTDHADQMILDQTW